MALGFSRILGLPQPNVSDSRVLVLGESLTFNFFVKKNSLAVAPGLTVRPFWLRFDPHLGSCVSCWEGGLSPFPPVAGGTRRGAKAREGRA